MIGVVMEVIKPGIWLHDFYDNCCTGFDFMLKCPLRF